MTIKNLTIYILLFIVALTRAQDKNVVAWLDANATPIEDATPTTPPTAFAASVPQKFKDARIFGFGEATHHGKEFFDLKAKFFKYLVENQGVKVFILESGYSNCREINLWLDEGTKTSREMARQLGFLIWMCEEMTDLLQWMKDYNRGKPVAERIRFYGMDDQFGHGINKQVRQFVTQYKLNIPEQQLMAADSCSALQYGNIKAERKWLENKATQLDDLKLAIEKATVSFTGTDKTVANETLHAIDVLLQYIRLTATPGIALRDEHMYQNVQWIMQQERQGSKAFIWAHNGHINKKGMAGYNVPSVGSRLKQYYGDAYYSMAFDFSKGRLYTTTIDKAENSKASVYTLDETEKKTYAFTFSQAKHDVFFIDMTTAERSPVMEKFLNSNKKQYYAGNGGFLKDHAAKKLKYPEEYDGVIFVKTISVPHYIKEAMPVRFYIE
ncbi:erythromycin esterase family protein [Flavobacterium sp. RHBU_3]|uniref:erythromycin esterase family protein n=1 Tax=Flavobacterium sp. RHBU_3 TaxID=3391184 RepID=UPI003984AEC2